MTSDAVLLYRWPSPLVEGVLLRRYERFIADVRLKDGLTVQAHCVNPGRMEGMVVLGARVWLSRAATERALPWTWELMELDGQLLGANTTLPNALVRAVLEGGALPGYRDVVGVEAERPFGRGHRVDFVVHRAEGEPELVEVKNCHLVYPDGLGYFPDSSSERARAHVDALARVVAGGGRATVLFTVQRLGVTGVRPSQLHAPAFAAAVRRAAKAGVVFRALRLKPSLEGISLDGEISVDVKRYDVGPIRAYARDLDATTGWVRKDGRWAGRNSGLPGR